MGLVGEWPTAVYGAALGFEDIGAAWFIPGFPHGVSECGASELQAAACAPDGCLILGLDCAKAVLSAPEGVGQRFPKELPRTHPSEQQSWGKEEVPIYSRFPGEARVLSTRLKATECPDSGRPALASVGGMGQMHAVSRSWGRPSPDTPVGTRAGSVLAHPAHRPMLHRPDNIKRTLRYGERAPSTRRESVHPSRRGHLTAVTNSCLS